MVLVIGFLLLAALAASATLSAIIAWLVPSSFPGEVLLWQAMNSAVSFVVITLLFAVIFKVLPDVIMSWRDVWIGAAVTAVLFVAGKYLLGVYLEGAGVASAYGAAGSLVIILVWVY